jgi:plastocyanin
MRKLMVVLVLGLLGIAGCGDGDGESGSGTSASESPPVSLQGATNDHGTKTASNDMEIELDDFYFAPTYVRATAGERITVELHNEGQAPHTFTSNGLGNIDEELAPGARKTITITASAGGAAVFYCRFHQGQGMQGAVVIG